MTSVIVPVYNVEKYLKQCVESILTQIYKDLEIILVDDGSKDSCLLGKQGCFSPEEKYLGVVESDDWIDPDMYERLYTKITQYHSDMVLCGWIREKLDGQRSFSKNHQFW